MEYDEHQPLRTVRCDVVSKLNCRIRQAISADSPGAQGSGLLHDLTVYSEEVLGVVHVDEGGLQKLEVGKQLGRNFHPVGVRVERFWLLFLLIFASGLGASGLGLRV